MTRKLKLEPGIYTRPGEAPTVYTVILENGKSLPNGEMIEIARSGQEQWQYLRTRDGKHNDWIGPYETPEAALAAIGNELTK